MQGMRAAAAPPARHALRPLAGALGARHGARALRRAVPLLGDLRGRVPAARRRWPAFLAGYLAITNLIEIALELWVTPWLIRHFGVPVGAARRTRCWCWRASARSASARLASGVAARVARELVDNAVAQPIRSLVYNALPLRLRGRIRAFLEGVVVYARHGRAGGLLLAAWSSPQPRALAALGGVAAALYLGAGLVVRARVPARARARDPRGPARPLRGRGHRPLRDRAAGRARAASCCARTTRGRRARCCACCRCSRSGARSSPCAWGCATRSADGARRLRRARSAPRATRRTSRRCARACADRRARRAARGAATRWPAGPTPRTGPRAELAALHADPDPGVRARAAALAGADGVGAGCARCWRSRIPDAASAAAALAPARLAAELAARARDADPRCAAPCCTRLAEVAPETPLPGARAAPTRSPGPSRGCAAPRCGCCARRPELGSRPRRARRSPIPRWRRAARRSRRWPRTARRASRAAQVYLRDGRERAVRAALEVVARVDAPSRRELLRRELLHHVRAAVDRRAGAAAAARRRRDVAATFLRLAWADEAARHRRLAFRILGHGRQPARDPQRLPGAALRRAARARRRARGALEPRRPRGRAPAGAALRGSRWTTRHRAAARGAGAGAGPRAARCWPARAAPRACGCAPPPRRSTRRSVTMRSESRRWSACSRCGRCRCSRASRSTSWTRWRSSPWSATSARPR